MNITRLNQAPEYVAPNHFDMQCLRLQGREAGPAVQLWMGMSIYEPGRRVAIIAGVRTPFAKAGTSLRALSGSSLANRIFPNYV